MPDMEESVTDSILGNGNMSVTTEMDTVDVRTLATSYLMYKIGECDKYDNIS